MGHFGGKLIRIPNTRNTLILAVNLSLIFKSERANHGLTCRERDKYKEDWMRPASLRERVGSRLPQFTDDERSVVQGSHMGIYFQNLYTAMYAKANQSIAASGCGYNC